MLSTSVSWGDTIPRGFGNLIFVKANVLNTILASPSHTEKIYFRMSFGIRYFFLCICCIFICSSFVRCVNNLLLAVKKSLILYGKTAQLRFLFIFRWSQFFFLVLHIKLSPLLLIYYNVTAGLKIKKQSLSKRHSPYTEESLWEVLVIRVSLQSIYYFSRVHSSEYLIFLYTGRVLWQNYYL